MQEACQRKVSDLRDALYKNKDIKLLFFCRTLLIARYTRASPILFFWKRFHKCGYTHIENNAFANKSSISAIQCMIFYHSVQTET